MIFSKTSEYALRALGFVARNEEGAAVRVSEVSKKTGVPAAYVAKIFQGLSKAGILVSFRGVNGGYGFKKAPDSVTIMDVIKATDNINESPLCGCIMGLKKCSDENPCALHPVWAESRDRLIKTMESTSVTAAFKKSFKKAFNGFRKNILSQKIREVLRP